MAKFNTKPSAPKPPQPDAAPDLIARAETVGIVESASASPQESVKRGKGRPPGEAREVFGTRLKAETIADVEAIKAGLRLKMQGEAIERAVAFYKAHVIAKTRQELRLAPEVNDDIALSKAFKADD